MQHIWLAHNFVNPYMFYKWIDGSLGVVLVWINNSFIAAPDHLIPSICRDIKAVFNCEDIGEMVEYIGCKVDCNCKLQAFKLTQLVKIEKFHKKFTIAGNPSCSPSTPAEPNSFLKGESEGENNIVLTKQEQKKY